MARKCFGVNSMWTNKKLILFTLSNWIRMKTDEEIKKANGQLHKWAMVKMTHTRPARQFAHFTRISFYFPWFDAIDLHWFITTIFVLQLFHSFVLFVFNCWVCHLTFLRSFTWFSLNLVCLCVYFSSSFWFLFLSERNFD